MVGNGEGLDQVAAWLNDRPGAPDLWIVSHSFDILQPLIVASGEPLRDRVPANADYVVLYRFQIQIGHSPRVLDEYLSRRSPDHVVWINGIEYARIYRGPRQLATEGVLTVAVDLSAGFSAPELDEDAADDSPTTLAGLSPAIVGWEQAVKPRLRRLRAAAIRLLPDPSDGSR
jgi:hypothetical protein